MTDGKLAEHSDFAPIQDARLDDTPWPSLDWPVPVGPDLLLSGRVVEMQPIVPDRDSTELFEALDHDAVWLHVAGRPADGDAYSTTLESQLAQGRLPWLVRLRVGHAGLAAGTVVGTSSYLDVSTSDARLEIGSTAFTPPVWGTAVNPEVKLLLLAHAFEVLGAGRVQLKTDVRNTRSQQAIARLGARYEGTLRRYQRRADGTVRDTVLFSITAEDWPMVREGLEQRLQA